MLQPKWKQFQLQSSALIQQEALPEQFNETVERYYLPLAQRIALRQQTLNRPLVVGVNGAQGTGKSTLALFLQSLLGNVFQLPCASFSLDDLYLTKIERIKLGQRIHPLFKTRGVPGTHDLALGQSIIKTLQSTEPDQPTAIPAFDKSIDDRLPEPQWPIFRGKAQVVLVEGWCVGAEPDVNESSLLTPINELERLEDEVASWRKHINLQLQGPYAEFFRQLDYLIMLRAPSMECVLQWRTLQEQKLASKLGVTHDGAFDVGGLGKDMPPGIMSKLQIERFVQHYERLTRRMLKELPKRADEVFSMNEDHQITSVVIHGQ